MASRRGPLLLLSYAALAVVIVLLDLPPLVAILLVAPFVLVAPGLSLVMALGIGSDPELPWRRLVLSIALSIATTALGGLLVNAFAPLTKASWTIWFVAFTCICCSLALLRGETQPAPPLRPRAARWYAAQGSLGRKWGLVAAGAVVVLLVVGAGVLTEVSSRRAYDTPIVQLSVAPLPGSNGRKVELSVSNLSGHAKRLQLTIARGMRRNTVKDVEVLPSRTWTSSEAVGPQGLSAVLTRPGRPRPMGVVTWSGVMPAPWCPGIRRADIRGRCSRSRRHLPARTIPAAESPW